MKLPALFADKSLKTKQKTETLSNWLLGKELTVTELIGYAGTAKDADKATCIEAMELASKKNPSIVQKEGFDFACDSLMAIAPRVKWESARVIGNAAHLYPHKLSTAIKNLLTNTEHEGTVVRWSAAYALGEILKLKSKHNTELQPAIEAIIKREEQNSIKKIYLAAIKALAPPPARKKVLLVKKPPRKE